MKSQPQYHRGLCPVQETDRTFEGFVDVCQLWPTDQLDCVRPSNIVEPTLLVGLPSDPNRCTVWQCNLEPHLRVDAELEAGAQRSAERVVREILDRENPLFVGFVAPALASVGGKIIRRRVGSERVFVVLAFGDPHVCMRMSDDGQNWFELVPNYPQFHHLNQIGERFNFFAAIGDWYLRTYGWSAGEQVSPPSKSERR